MILELAFGTGNMLLDLHWAHYHPVGIDLSSAMIRIARRKLRRHSVAVPLVRGRAQWLPFADASFDSILCTFPAEFIVVPDTLSQIARVLRPGGRAVIVAMARLLVDAPWVRFLEWLYRITGQRGPLPDLRSQLRTLGLEYRTMWKSTESSAVLLVVAEKRVDG
jgi:ubiquinone/menaquinone biosynthesis C-methylase UbiE